MKPRVARPCATAEGGSRGPLCPSTVDGNQRIVRRWRTSNCASSPVAHASRRAVRQRSQRSRRAGWRSPIGHREPRRCRCPGERNVAVGEPVDCQDRHRLWMRARRHQRPRDRTDRSDRNRRLAGHAVAMKAPFEMPVMKTRRRSAWSLRPASAPGSLRKRNVVDVIALRCAAARPAVHARLLPSGYTTRNRRAARLDPNDTTALAWRPSRNAVQHYDQRCRPRCCGSLRRVRDGKFGSPTDHQRAAARFVRQRPQSVASAVSAAHARTRTAERSDDARQARATVLAHPT